MLAHYKFTDKELKSLIESMVILVDTREQDGKNANILDYFDRKGIKYKKKALTCGDYSFMIPKNEELSIPRDLWFDNKVMIEKKSGLEEISGNLSSDRSRLEKEFALAPNTKVLLIENANYEDIAKNNYNTQYNRKSFLASLHTFWFRYNIPVFFIKDKKYTGLFIREYFEYFLKEYIKK